MTIRHKCRPIDTDDWLLLSCIPIGCCLHSLREKYDRFYCCILLHKNCLHQLRHLRLRTFVFRLRSFLVLFCLRTFSYTKPKYVTCDASI